MAALTRRFKSGSQWCCMAELRHQMAAVHGVFHERYWNKSSEGARSEERVSVRLSQPLPVLQQKKCCRGRGSNPHDPKGHRVLSFFSVPAKVAGFLSNSASSVVWQDRQT